MQAHHCQPGGPSCSVSLLKAAGNASAPQLTSAHLHPSILQPFWVQLPRERTIYLCTLPQPPAPAWKSICSRLHMPPHFSCTLQGQRSLGALIAGQTSPPCSSDNHSL